MKKFHLLGLILLALLALGQGHANADIRNPSGQVNLTGGEQYLSDPSILLVGDSTSSQNDNYGTHASGSITLGVTRYQKAFTWFDNFLGGSLNYDTALDGTWSRNGSNAGHGGDIISNVTNKVLNGDVYTNFVPLSRFPQKYFWVQVGTNDINAASPLATLISDYTAMIDAIVGAGKIPILTTVLPRNATDGSSDWNSNGNTAAQKRLILNSFNTWMKDYAKEKNLICIDWTSVFSDSTGNAKTGYTIDSVHPSSRGSYYLAQEAYRQIGYLFPRSRLGQQNGYDAYDATYNPYGNILNGKLSGTGGNLSAGSGTGTVTGTVADNFQLSKNTTTTTSVAASIVTRNGRTAQKLVFTSTGGGSASEDFRFSYWNGSSNTLSSWAATGDYLAVEAGIELEAGTEGVLKSILPRAGINSATALVASTISFNAVSNTINDSGNGLAIFPPGFAINVAGSASNNKAYIVSASTAGTLTISPSTPVTTEAAGSSITIRLPAVFTSMNASGELYPNENTGVFWMRAPTLYIPVGGNITPRIGFYINGTIAGTATVYIYEPTMRKRRFKPSVLNYVATDD